MPTRTYQEGVHVATCMPITTPKDIGRQQSLAQKIESLRPDDPRIDHYRRTCACLANNCNCHLANPLNVATFLHSIYYFTREQIIDILCKTTTRCIS